MTLVLVDAENVRRSQWPNVSAAELVRLVCQWAAREGREAVVVFDGRAPATETEGGPGEHCTVVGTAGESADDWIARRTRDLAARGESYRLVTSDRGLRARAAGDAEAVVGGGAFLRELLAG
jgi:predicted RNA-binding protein with PIN domain